MEAPTKRKFLGGPNAPNKAAKMSAGGGSKMSFAQKMMAKMGHVEGQGLGREGEGIVNPIEVKMRPQGVGVGAVKEKTQQYKDEQRRAAERRGEEFEDSSEEERKARKDRKKKSHNVVTNGSASTPGGSRKPKTKYKTVADVQAAAPGLEVPSQMLSSILDATGTETKLLTSTAGLMSSGGVLSESEADRIARRERLELEAFIEAWHGVQEQKVLIGEQEGQHEIELEQRSEDLQKVQSLVQVIDDLKLKVTASSSLTATTEGNVSVRWSSIMTELSHLQENHRHEIERYNVPEAAIGALSSTFKQLIVEWDPLTDPTFLVNDLEQLRLLIGLTQNTEIAALDQSTAMDLDQRSKRRPKATSAYESLMYTVWLPKIRTTVTNWDVLDHVPLTNLVHAWRPLLPDFVFSNLMDRLIVPRLVDGLQTWDPRKRNHHHKHDTLKYAQPHTWLFPWLPYLSPHQLDPKASIGFMVDLKRRLKQVFDGWDVGRGALPGLTAWREFLHSDLDHLLIRHLLPRLARHLSQNFEVDPSDQDLTPLENVLQWQNHFKPEVFARLLVAEFFTKWLFTLHLWLASNEANFEEVGEWFAWWKSQIPEKLSAHPDVVAEWQKGDRMINDALDLQDEGIPLSELPAPAAGPARPIAQELAKKISAQATVPPQQVPGQDLVQDFKDVVEAWCAEEDLTMVPLREANPQNGAPLFRITASATGKGGVIVYFKGDLVWAQRKNDRTTYEPMGLEEKLVQRAEGK